MNFNDKADDKVLKDLLAALLKADTTTAPLTNVELTQAVTDNATAMVTATIVINKLGAGMRDATALLENHELRLRGLEDLLRGLTTYQEKQ